MFGSPHEMNPVPLVSFTLFHRCSHSVWNWGPLGRIKHRSIASVFDDLEVSLTRQPFYTFPLFHPSPISLHSQLLLGMTQFVALALHSTPHGSFGTLSLPLQTFIFMRWRIYDVGEWIRRASLATEEYPRGEAFWYVFLWVCFSISRLFTCLNRFISHQCLHSMPVDANQRTAVSLSNVGGQQGIASGYTLVSSTVSSIISKRLQRLRERITQIEMFWNIFCLLSWSIMILQKTRSAYHLLPIHFAPCGT